MSTPDGNTFGTRIPHPDLLQIVPSQNLKQRIQNTVEYFLAD